MVFPKVQFERTEDRAAFEKIVQEEMGSANVPAAQARATVEQLFAAAQAADALVPSGSLDAVEAGILLGKVDEYRQALKGDLVRGPAVRYGAFEQWSNGYNVYSRHSRAIGYVPSGYRPRASLVDRVNTATSVEKGHRAEAAAKAALKKEAAEAIK